MLGVFDSGFGGLTVLKAIHNRLPSVSTIYLGDNNNAPYGIKTPEQIFELTLAGVRKLFQAGCPLVVLACNSASAQALSRIQKEILPVEFPNQRVLGVIRPAAEEIINISHNGHIGILATSATVTSKTYLIEIAKLDDSLHVSQVACPDLVPLIEDEQHQTEVISAAVKRYLTELFELDSEIDTILLGCTHYPLILDLFRLHTPKHIQIVTQGQIIADKLADYLVRHPELANQICHKAQRRMIYSEVDHHRKAHDFYADFTLSP